MQSGAKLSSRYEFFFIAFVRLNNDEIQPVPSREFFRSSRMKPTSPISHRFLFNCESAVYFNDTMILAHLSLISNSIKFISFHCLLLHTHRVISDLTFSVLKRNIPSREPSASERPSRSSISQFATAVPLQASSV